MSLRFWYCRREPPGWRWNWEEMRWIELDAGGRLKNYSPADMPHIVYRAEDVVELSEAFGYCGA